MRDPRSLFLGVALGAVLALSPVSRAELPIGNQFAAAIESGSLERVQALVDKGNGPDTLIEYGENKITPLMKASWEGELAIVEYLLAKGANLEYTNADGQTALHEAIGREHADVVAFLLAKGAKTEKADVRDFRPIHKAAAAGNVPIIELLAKAKASLSPEMYGLTPLMFAVSAKKPEAVEALVRLGAPVNYASKTGNVGQTALYSAIQTGDVEMVKLLLSLKANPNAKTKGGTTLLKQAQNGDQDEIVALLKKAGAKG